MNNILSPQDFEIHIDEITDFTPYLTQKNNKYRKLMATYGKEINELLSYDYGWTSDIEDVKIQLINNGYAKEHWDDWKKDRQLKSKEDYNNAFLALEKSHDKDLIKYLIDNYDNYYPECTSRFELESYQIAYESMLREPSLIEQTMSPCQMFQTENVLWAKGLNKNQINTIRRYHRFVAENGNENAFLSHFNELARPTNSERDMAYIYRQL